MPHENTPESAVDAPAPVRGELFQVTRAQFDSVPQKRAWYILAYLLIQGTFFADRLYEMRYGALSETVATVLIVFFFVCYVTMYINFVGALRIMGHDWLVVIPTCILAFFPLFSLLPVGIMDRRLADQWDSAQKKQTQYRQHVQDRGPDGAAKE